MMNNLTKELQKLQSKPDVGIRELTCIAGMMSLERGFHDMPNELHSNIVSDKGKECFNNMVISQRLMLITSELAEGLEAVRERKYANLSAFNKEIEEGFDTTENFVNAFKANIKNTFEDEMADVLIRLLDMCYHLNIDIVEHAMLKARYNDTRPPLHNKEF